MIGLNRAKRPGGRTAPSRTAAIGATRVARIAGRRLANSVITVPSKRQMTTVRVANTVPAVGRSIPIATKSWLSSLASPSPRNRPTTEPKMPMISASTITDVRIWRRDAPIVRKVANSRVRCAIVMPSVFAITKLPTNSAMPAKARRKLWMNVVKPLTVFLSSFTCALASRACAVGGSNGLICVINSDEVTPLFAWTRITSS